MTMAGLAGGIECFWDEALLDIARLRFNRAHGQDISRHELRPSDEQLIRCGFVATRDPWRLALLNLEPVVESGWPAVVGWAEQGWLALEADPPAVIGDLGNQAKSHGDIGARALLETGWLKVVTGNAHLDDRFDVAAESMYRLHDEWEWAYALGLSPGEVDRHEVVYQPELECITSWTSWIDGKVAQRLLLSPITPL